MPKFYCFLVISFIIVYSSKGQSLTSDSTINSPIAKKEPRKSIFHGDTLIDNYYWMRKKNDVDLINYLYAENGYTANKMKDTEAFQQRLYREMKERLPVDSYSSKKKIGNYLYYSKIEKGQNYRVYFRKKLTKGSVEEVILDMNQVAEQSPFTNLVQFVISPNQEYLAYSVDFVGSGKGSIYFKNLRSGEEINDEIHNTGQIVWGGDNETIFYASIDSTNRGNRILKHHLNSSVTNDVTVYEETDSTYNLGIYPSISKKYLFMVSSATIGTEVSFMRLGDKNEKWTMIQARKEGIKYVPQHFDGDDYFTTLYEHSGTASNGAIKKVAIKNRGKQWSDFLPAHISDKIENYIRLKDYLVLQVRRKGLQQLKVIPIRNGAPVIDASYIVKLGASTYSISLNEVIAYDETKFQFVFSSFTQPTTIYEYNLENKKLEIVQKLKLLGYDPTKYTSERHLATAKDGTLIPISLVYKKGLNKDGNNPLYLNAYGAFGISSDPYFDANRISLLDRGVIYAIAHVRGGGEFGAEWHNQGKLLHKMNSFTDFFDCATYLINQGYTNSDKLVAQGASSGGLLAGAAAVLEPELFQGVIINVPFLDVINTQSDPSIPVAALESYEWGDPFKKEIYNYMLSYSPYDNIEAKSYPNILVQGGYHDINVGFWEAPKFVAKMREFKTDSNLLLLNMNMNGGHGLTSGRYGHLKQEAFSYAFIFKILGIKSEFAKIRGTVKDEQGEPMPYVNVVIKSTTTGTTTNANGEFELELKRGKYNLEFMHVGFTRQEKGVSLEDDTNLAIVLKTEDILLKTVEITSKYEDPAYAIIKAAIKKRKSYLKQVDKYAAQVYIRADNRFDKIPEKKPFFIPKGDMPDSSDLGLMYLSESEANLYMQYPDRVKEVMVSSKVAGNSQGYSWNRAAEVNFNFYKNLILIRGLSERGFVSPIADNAMFFYKYEYIGTKEEKDAMGNKIFINKIKVIPKRKNDPVFSGHIYIVEDSWRISALNLRLEDHQIEIFDEFKVEQNYLAVTDAVWMPLSIKFFVHLSIFGFGISGSNIISYYNYDINPTFPPKFFNNEVFKIEKQANQRDTSYWFENRPISLTSDEIDYYKEKDKIEIKKQSKHYLDSLDKAENTTSWQDIFDGFWYYKRYKKETFSTNAVPDMINFNTVEGLNLNFQFRYQKGEWDEKHFRWISTLRYGFANQRFNAKTSLFWTLDRQKHQSLLIEGGRFVRQFNNTGPIYPIINTFYTLAFRENYMKLYGSDYAQANYKQELSNGIYLDSKLGYEQRTPLVNTTNYSFKKESIENGDVFTSNNPVDPTDFEPSFAKHEAMVVDISLKFLINQRYLSRPNRKIPLGSKYPKFTINYKKGIPLLGSDVDFDFLSINVGDDIDLGLFGKLSYDVSAGQFLNSKAVEFMDFKHFNGNQTIFINYTERLGLNRVPLDRFQLLDYYRYSTIDRYLEGHLEFHGNGFIVNKLPLLRKTKFQAVGGVNLLLGDDVEYIELSAGLENILKAFRVDFVAGYDQREKLKGAIRMRLGLNGL